MREKNKYLIKLCARGLDEGKDGGIKMDWK
jgi:hypothetical protein